MPAQKPVAIPYATAPCTFAVCDSVKRALRLSYIHRMPVADVQLVAGPRLETMDTTQFDHAEGWRAALLAALAEDTRNIDWFDVDLSESVAHEVAATERIKTLLASSPLTRVRLLLHDDKFFWRHCQRLVLLQQTYGHAFEIRLTSEADRHPAETFLLMDRSVVRRFHPDSHRGESSEDGRQKAICRQAFHLMWQHAQPAQEGRRLGI
jgi:hypothetical protein